MGKTTQDKMLGAAEAAIYRAAMSVSGTLPDKFKVRSVTPSCGKGVAKLAVVFTCASGQHELTAEHRYADPGQPFTVDAMHEAFVRAGEKAGASARQKALKGDR